MDPIQTIVAAVDLSKCSREVLKAARRLAELLNARIEVIHVVLDLKKYMGFYVGAGSVKDLQKNLVKEAVAKLEALQDEVLGDWHNTRLQILKGTPYSTLVRHIRKLEGDLLVLGAHGPKKPEHKLHGSTAKKLIKSAPCPVLVVGQD